MTVQFQTEKIFYQEVADLHCQYLFILLVYRSHHMTLKIVFFWSLHKNPLSQPTHDSR